MKRKILLLAAITLAVVCVYTSFSSSAYASAPNEGPSPQTASPANHATVDITINDAGDVSVGGINLAQLGLSRLDPQVATAFQNLGDVHLQVQDEEVTVNLQGDEVAKVLWSPATRQAAANLAASYGVAIHPEAQGRIEDWISSSNLDVTARYSNEESKPFNLSLTTPLLVDIASNGQLAVEKGPLAAGIDTGVLQQIQMGGNQATACWNKGTLTASVDGAELPTLILNPDGIQKLTQALNVQLDTDAVTGVLGSRFGVDLSLPGGAHQTDAACAE